ncbi:DMT family transporter [Guyparkeria hydrothermalis]|uniref:DMT family transporter n=1 Tax=Guyparkeria TaxID=2035712 RepID=UPI0010ACCF40|nr:MULTISPECIES: EamA family transporter [Guyparkeria]MCL7750702.1 DMT family transporter [Guyparkeria hydrothermalis]TKA88637.1 EamA family transporter [Guyparkeria sp. SB14A]
MSEPTPGPVEDRDIPRHAPIALLPLLALLLLGFFWGYNWVVMKAVLVDVSAAWFAALRTVLPALLLIAILPLAGKRLRPPPLFYALPIGLFQTAGFVGFMMWALQSGGGAGETAVIVFMMPLWLTLMAHFALDERITRVQLLAIGLALPGLVLLISPWEAGLMPAAVLLAFASGFGWALGAIWQKRYYHRYQPDLLSLTAWQMLYGGLLLLAIALWAEPFAVDPTPNFLWALFYNVVLAGAIGWLLWVYSLHHLPTWIAGFGALLVPGIGVLSAWLVLGETPGPVKQLGIGLILSALLIITLYQRRARQRARRRAGG